MIAKLKRAIAQGKRLWNAYAPLGSIVWKRYRKELIKIVVYSVSSVGAQAVLIFVLVGGIRLLNPDDSIQLFGFEDYLSANPTITLTLIVVLYVLIGCFTAITGWWRDFACRKVARLFLEDETTGGLAKLAGAGVQPREFPRKMVNRAGAFIQNPMITAVALEIKLRMVTPIVQLAAFTAALIILEWRLVFVAIPLLAIPLPALFFLNRGTHRASSRYYGQERHVASQRLMELISDSDTGTRPGEDLVRDYRNDEQISAINDDMDLVVQS